MVERLVDLAYRHDQGLDGRARLVLPARDRRLLQPRDTRLEPGAALPSPEGERTALATDGYPRTPVFLGLRAMAVLMRGGCACNHHADGTGCPVIMVMRSNPYVGLYIKVSTKSAIDSASVRGYCARDRS
jgi:hypothetical protein